MVDDAVDSADMTRAMAAAREAMAIESAAISRTGSLLDGTFEEVVRLMHRAPGRVIVSGLGKSGHVAAKIAATLASTGTPAFFVHSTEALHGDSGMATAEDVAVLISYSGETAEVCQFAAVLAARQVPVVAMTGRATSTLARYAVQTLSIEVEREADPLNLAPTASTAATLALGDALAAALMTLGGFGPDDFAARHPGGSLGRRLLGDQGGVR